MLDDVLTELDVILHLEQDDLDPNTLGLLEHLLQQRKCNWVELPSTDPVIPHKRPLTSNQKRVQNVST